jgi:peptidoglycan hydrolase-like protein with peptidoglycan-binding domain
MPHRALVLALVFSLAAACGHPQHVTDVPGNEAPRSTEGKNAEKAKASVHPGGGRPTVPSAPEGIMAPGAIADIQEALAQRGLLKAHRKGELDTPTSEAIQRFQRSQDLAETGFPDKETLEKLQLDPKKAYGREEQAKP